MDQMNSPSQSAVSKKLIIVYLIAFIIGLFAGFILFSKYNTKVSDTHKKEIEVDFPALNNKPLPAAINNSILYFKTENELYKKNSLTGQAVIELNQADSFSFSPDYSKIAYTRTDDRNENGSIYLKDLINNTIQKIIATNTMLTRSISWSPEGNYLLTDNGTGPQGVMNVYDAKTYKKISSFPDGRFVWKNDNTIFINTQVPVEPYRPWGEGAGSNLSEIDFLTGKIKTILSADANTDYHIIEIDDKCLYYRRETVTDPVNWGIDSETSSDYWCYDFINQTTTEQIEDIEPKNQIMRENVLKAFPEYNQIDKNEVLQAKENPNFPNWTIFTLHHGNSIYNSEIFIFNSNDPKNTLYKLADGCCFEWQ